MGNRFYTTSLEDRLLTKTVKTDSCWVWSGAYNEHPDTCLQYGRIYADGKLKYVHRVAYELWVGPIPDGLVIDHVVDRGCVSTLCVNPQHLEPVTQAVNLARRKVAPITVCGRGHLMTEENTRRDKKGRRKGCRECHREDGRKRVAG